MDSQRYEDLIKKQQYILQMRPVFKTQALFTDETENYVFPMEPEPGEEVRIRFRTAADNVDTVFFISGDRRIRMQKVKSERRFDYYEVALTMDESILRYYFEIKVGKVRCFYNKKGVSRDLQPEFSFAICPGFHTPQWAKGAVMYQIFTDRFFNGSTDNDVLDHEYFYNQKYSFQSRDWYKVPEHDAVQEFYGGDLQGVMRKLDYLQELGVDVIYFNPLFVSPSNHKYDIQDYDYIDPHFAVIKNDEGALLWDHTNANAARYISRVTDLENLEASNAYFAELCEEIHRRGMRVILDGVFNHCGSFNKWMDRERIYEKNSDYEKGAYTSADSPYRSFFRFHNLHEWPYNPFYEGWWNFDTLPKLNYEESEKLEEYILGIAKKWVSPPFNVDGWRLDVAADLGFAPEYNHKFWRKFRKVVKEANPDSLILAEHYGDARSWLQGDQWDTVMNYDAFMEPVTWFFTGMEKHSDSFSESQLGNTKNFWDAMLYHMTSFMAPSLQVAMNELSNHDHSRFLTRTNHAVGRVAQLGNRAAEENVNPAVMREAVVLQMTWPGCPTLYYGDEAGLCGFTDPDNRRTYPWGREDQTMLSFHREMIKIHKTYPVFTHGSLVVLGTEDKTLAYGRFSGEERMIVLFNQDEEERELLISVYETEIQNSEHLVSLIETTKDGFSREEKVYPVVHGRIRITLPANSAMVLRAEA